MGVWIETSRGFLKRSRGKVTPCMGVWIETRSMGQNKNPTTSHPVWVCGLKP